jgi:uncharacterized membrane protein
MNKLLVVTFDNEIAADAGTHVLKDLHADGGITLYAWSVIAKDAQGVVTVKRSVDKDDSGMAVGLAIGSLIGLLGGPVGFAVGAVAGTAIGALRDFLVAGVGIDFIEQADADLQRGKVAVIAEIDEEWLMPVDSRMAAVGGRVLRRSRADAGDAQFDRDAHAFHAEISSITSEAAQAGGAAKIQLQEKLTAAREGLTRTMRRAQQRADELKREGDSKVHALETQIGKTKGEVSTKLHLRMATVRDEFNARTEKLEQAWSLTKEAVTR